MVFDLKAIGKKIKAIRREKGLTQANLSEQLDITDRTLNLMENGKCGMKIETLINFCNVLGVSPNYILSYKSDDNSLQDILEMFTPKQQAIIKEFLLAFEKLSDSISKN